MSKPDTVTQCRLRNGNSELVSWIDSDVAVLGKRMTIDDDAIPGIFEVISVGDTISRQALQKQEGYHRTHRRGTDI